MATAIPMISMEDYLQAVYRPDREYVDGELKERNAGKYEHSLVQALLATWFMNHLAEWHLVPLTEQRVQVSPTRIRLPDVTLIPPGPTPDVIVEAPLLVIEILSPEDTHSGLQERCMDYRQMGCTQMWIIDPKTRTGRTCRHDDWLEMERLEIAGSPVFLDHRSLYSDLDRIRS